MSRLTKNISDKQTYCGYEVKDCKYQQIYDFKKYSELEDYVDCDLTLAIDKLGELEDLMGKYKIENTDVLEKIIVRHDSYTMLEEEIGCPLDVVFRALRDGVYVLDEETGGTKHILRGFVNHTQDYEMEEFGFVDDRVWAMIKDEETGLDIPIVYAWNDYKKTWWLREDKSE